MRKLLTTLATLAGLGIVIGCERSANQDAAKPAGTPAAKGVHQHADGSRHADHDAETTHPRQQGREGDIAMGQAQDHAHDEVSLGAVTIGDMKVELAQAHGKVQAGKEGHLVVKLPYNDGGKTIVRAWIGDEDRTMSLVGKGEYAPSHDDFDIHAVAPDPLPENAMWWIEIEKPDGTKAVGSAPLLK